MDAEIGTDWNIVMELILNIESILGIESIGAAFL